ncbi:MAG: hypothetical protein PSN34_06370 [Urechidicola sp.]|nr:hypothetical protein [Urechidicola sp.]
MAVHVNKKGNVVIEDKQSFNGEVHYMRITAILDLIKLQDEAVMSHSATYYAIDLVQDMLPSRTDFIELLKEKE